MGFFDTLMTLDWHMVGQLTLQHVRLVSIAVALAIVIGVPIGMVTVRWPVISNPLMMAATVASTVPAIALFGIMMPLYSRFGQGLGPAPAVTAVFLYSLLPIMRNTHTALLSVDPGIREAGRGIGMTFWQRLYRVDFPLALPGIFTGIRTAMVMNIGTMTIAAVIGAGGLGLLLLNAIGQSNIHLLVIGAIIVSVLAIIADVLLHVLQYLLTSKGIRT